MQSHDRAKSKPKMVDEVPFHSRKQAETRLVLLPLANPQAAEAALKQVIEDWVLPRLLEEFLREKGITPKSRFPETRVFSHQKP
jgi:hypothetical protein